MAGDMTKSKDIAASLDAAETALGPLHCAIANVGLAAAKEGYDVSDEIWERDIAQNLLSAAYLAREATRRMLAYPEETRGDANIIFISSIAGNNAYKSQITYSTAKAGMNHLARDMSKHLARDGIRLNVVAPGNIMFEGGVWDRNVKANPDGIAAWIKRDVPMRRFGKPEEIADAALFLASPRASFVTGETLLVDGGQTR
jgi:3-oxoacyl-[acyl-carrier protein] reductase